MDPHSSHLYSLALAIRTFGNRVLEIGVGWYSTNLIHGICPDALSIEEDIKWCEQFQSIFKDKIIHRPNVSDGLQELITGGRLFDVVFVDSYHDEDRIKCVKLLWDINCCIVAHDTERDYWNEVISSMKYKRHFKDVTPNTSWLSNIRDVSNT